MRKDEAIIKIINELEDILEIDPQQTKLILENVLSGYSVTPLETALVPMNNMQELAMMFLSVKRLEGATKSTIEGYTRNISKLYYDLMKNVEDITTMDVRMHLANYAKTGVKKSTIATRTDIFKSFFSWLKMEEYISKNPMSNIKTIKEDGRLREPLTSEEMEVLISGATTLREKAILSFFYASCVRLSELVSVDISDVDFNNCKLNVIGKGNKERTVYFNVRAKINLKNYLNSRDDDCEALFVTKNAPIGRFGNRGVQREIKQIQKKSGLKKNVFPHILRHTGASHMLSKGINIETIQEILGHSDLNTTKIYSKSSQPNIEYEYKKYMAN